MRGGEWGGDLPGPPHLSEAMAVSAPRSPGGAVGRLAGGSGADCDLSCG